MRSPLRAPPQKTITAPQPYFSAPDFNFASAKKASGNVAGLCNWAEAMCKYHAVATQVEPKIVALREAEAELRVAGRERMEVSHWGWGMLGTDVFITSCLL